MTDKPDNSETSPESLQIKPIEAIMTTHSPLPWRIGYSDGSGAEPNNGSYTIQTMDDEFVIDGYKGDRQDTGVLDLDDAELIVRAVNSHQSLVDALESIAKNTCCGKCQEAAWVAREALSKLRGETA